MNGRSVATFLFWMTFVCANSALAQVSSPTGVHRDTLAGAQPYQLNPIVLPGSESIWIQGARLDTNRYRIDYRYGRLWIDGAQPAEQVIAEYRTLPRRVKDAYRLYTISPPDTAERSAPDEQEPLIARPSTSRLQSRGSITRGILAGSNRDVTVESGLRMELSGEVADGVDIQAVLTDENTPILPEGTTQRLEEFDRVFIGIDAPYGTAQLGDFDLQFASSEFGRFNRKLQGASATIEVPPGPFVGEGHVTIAGATSRGTFRTQEIEPIDGVQGPYRLEGSEGERFVLVIPGSETVYLDGEQATRGETNHYTIDYATAEITFTPNVIVTEDKRIQVEFQYTTGQFTRTLIGSQAETRFWRSADGSSRARFGASVIREADSRDFSEEFGFGREDSLALVNAGDGIAAVAGAERVEFDPESPYVQYRQEITGDDTIYVALDAAPPDGAAVYRVRFSRIGDGLGSYARVGRSVNGILYEYRGRGQGDYLPIRILQKPKRHRLVDLHGAVEPVNGLELFGEWSRSANDENRFSPLDEANDMGDAYLVGARIEPVDLGFAHLSGQLRRRFVAGTFEAFNRIRPVEFERKWNLPPRAELTTDRLGDEVIDEGDLQVQLLEQSVVSGELGRIELGGGFRGLRRAAFLQSAEPGLPHVEYRVELIGSRDAVTDESGRWLRQAGTVRFPLGRIVPRFELDHERRRRTLTDSLAQPSFTFVEYRPGLAWERENLELDAYLELRNEDDWIDGAVREAARSWTGQTRISYRPSNTFDIDGNIGFRSRQYTDEFRIEQNREDVESLILRLGTNYRPLDRAVQINWMYEGMAERTPTLQEIYVRTGPEIGQFVWEDANDDGLVQIDEMIPERLPNEGTYVKTFIPSDSLTSVVNVEGRLRLELDPSRLWPAPNTTLQKWLSEITTRTVLEVREKTRDPNLTQVYLLDLSRFRNPEHTMNGRFRIGHDMFLFRNRPNYGVDVSFSQLRSLSELAAGEEERFVNSWTVEGRLRPNDAWGLRAVAGVEQDRLSSESFVSRRYDIEALRVEPEASYSLTRALQLVAAPEFARKVDAIGNRRVRIIKLPTELRYSRPRRLQVTARVEAADIRLTGQAVGLAQYELTDGRGPGRSYLWTLRGQYTINEYLRASFSYDGRSPSEAPVIHTMQLQLSAIF